MERPRGPGQTDLEGWAEKKIEEIERREVDLRFYGSEEAVPVEREKTAAFQLLPKIAPFAVGAFLLLLVSNIGLGGTILMGDRLSIMSWALLIAGACVYGFAEWEKWKGRESKYEAERKQYALEQRKKLRQTEREDLAVDIAQDHDVGPDEGVRLARAYVWRYSGCREDPEEKSWL